MNETAVERQLENAAERTGPADTRRLVYIGFGMWQTPYGRAEAPKDADPEEIFRRAREMNDGQ